jgi:hypothetical protein
VWQILVEVIESMPVRSTGMVGCFREDDQPSFVDGAIFCFPIRAVSMTLHGLVIGGGIVRGAFDVLLRRRLLGRAIPSPISF